MTATPSVGDTLIPLQRAMTLPRLVMYAGASWDWHRLHYDTEHAAEAQLSGPIVDGQMFGGIFVNQVTDTYGYTTRVTGMDLKFRSMVFADETIDVTGEITNTEPSTAGMLVTIDQEISVGDRICATASTTAIIN